MSTQEQAKKYTDWEDLVASYTPAADFLEISREELDETLRVAMRFKSQCPSCRFSRATTSALQQAKEFGILTIYERRCLISPPLRKCSHWESLEPPPRPTTEKETT